MNNCVCASDRASGWPWLSDLQHCGTTQHMNGVLLGHKVWSWNREWIEKVLHIEWRRAIRVCLQLSSFVILIGSSLNAIQFWSAVNLSSLRANLNFFPTCPSERCVPSERLLFCPTTLSSITIVINAGSEKAHDKLRRGFCRSVVNWFLTCPCFYNTASAKRSWRLSFSILTQF